jgi:hypothetical protein
VVWPVERGELGSVVEVEWRSCGGGWEGGGEGLGSWVGVIGCECWVSDRSVSSDRWVRGEVPRTIDGGEEGERGLDGRELCISLVYL